MFESVPLFFLTLCFLWIGVAFLVIGSSFTNSRILTKCHLDCHEWPTTTTTTSSVKQCLTNRPFNAKNTTLFLFSSLRFPLSLSLSLWPEVTLEPFNPLFLSLSFPPLRPYAVIITVIAVNVITVVIAEQFGNYGNIWQWNKEEEEEEEEEEEVRKWEK